MTQYRTSFWTQCVEWTGQSSVLYTYGDSDEISSYHIYASCFSTML